MHPIFLVFVFVALWTCWPFGDSPEEGVGLADLHVGGDNVLAAGEAVFLEFIFAISLNIKFMELYLLLWRVEVSWSVVQATHH